MSEDYQIGFKVKGLRAPLTENVFGENILIRGIPPSEDAYVFFKVKIQNFDEEQDKVRNHFLNALRNIVHMYGLITKNMLKSLLVLLWHKFRLKIPLEIRNTPQTLLNLLQF